MARHLEKSGSIRVAAPARQAFWLFTPEGERIWVPGWQPEYLYPLDGEMVEGLTFRTRHRDDEITLWLVSRYEAARAEVEYVRVTPGSRIGTVSVRCDAVSAADTLAAITYRLTALSPAGETALDTFAVEFDGMLATWERSIAASRPPL